MAGVTPARNAQLRQQAERFYARQIYASVDKAAKSGLAWVKRLMQPPSPSEPGRPPAVDMGYLKKAQQCEVEIHKDAIVGRIGSNHHTQRALELGGPQKGYIYPTHGLYLKFWIKKDRETGLPKFITTERVLLKPRPHLRPGLTRAFQVLKIELSRRGFEVV